MNIQKDRMWFFEEPDDNGGGGEAPEIDTMGAAPTGEPSTLEPEPKAPAFDPNAFAKTLGESVTAAIAKSQPKVEPAKTPLTPEEARKALNVWEPSDEWLTRYDNLETRKAAIAEQRDNLMKQFDTVTQIRLHQLQETLEAKYSPIVAHMQQQEATARAGRFDASFPQLADPGLRPLIGAITQQLTAEGKTFTSETDLYKEVATRAEAVIKTTNPAFKLSAQAVKKSSGIPVTTPGAGGGGGGGGKATTQKSTVLSVLGDLD